jgi:cytochrome o ubiquinol oxidase subunit 2
MTDADFNQWAANIAKGADNASAGSLDTVAYLQLEQPSERNRSVTSPPLMMVCSTRSSTLRPSGKMCVRHDGARRRGGAARPAS